MVSKASFVLMEDILTDCQSMEGIDIKVTSAYVKLQCRQVLLKPPIRRFDCVREDLPEEVSFPGANWVKMMRIKRNLSGRD
jgi:hypothetical protein